MLEAGDDAEKAHDRARDAKERTAAAVDLAALGPAGYVAFIAGTACLQTPGYWSAPLTPSPSFVHALRVERRCRWDAVAAPALL